MGCDIHAYIEVKVKGQWHLYSQPRFRRRYALFTKLAGVRDVEGVEPISEPKGLPEDLSVMVKLEREYDGSDAHSDSYLNREELEKFTDWVNDPKNKFSDFHGQYEHEVIGYAGGNPLSCIGQYPDEEPCHPKEYEDVRMVFWFDN